MPDPFTIEYSYQAADELRALRATDRTKIVTAIVTHLKHEPKKTSRSRIKEMEQPFWSQYRLRVEDFRVYYDVTDDLRKVLILRIVEKGTKETPAEGPSNEKA